MSKKLTLILLMFPFMFMHSYAQNHKHHKNDHDHEKHRHSHELGLSLAPTWFSSENELNAGLHLHYVYNLLPSKFGLGIGYERIFDDHKHNFVGAEVVYRPFHALSLDISPGLAFEGGHGDEMEFALHFETAYEFEFGAFHLGPLIEVAYHPEDWHFSTGIHIGFGL